MNRIKVMFNKGIKNKRRLIKGNNNNNTVNYKKRMNIIIISKDVFKL